jgi:hypothetical protein
MTSGNPHPPLSSLSHGDFRNRKNEKSYAINKGNKVAGTQQHGTRATARIAQGLLNLEVITEPLKRFRVQCLDAKLVVVCPLREAVYATHQAQDTARLLPTLFEPENEGIEMGTCGARTVSLEGEGPF